MTATTSTAAPTILDTRIVSNGSKWAGQAPDTLADLVSVLATHPLDVARFPHGFAYNMVGRPGWVMFWGNFATVSHVFQIETNDPAVCALLTNAIKANLATLAA